MSSRLSRIRERLDAATPGPWFVKPDSTTVATEDESVRWICEVTGSVSNSSTMADADFIAHAPDDIRLLLNIVEAAQAYRQAQRNKHLTMTDEHERERLDAALVALDAGDA